jgi:hypothetical protein
LASALLFAAEVHMYRREGQSTYEQAEAALGLAREHGFAFRVAQATILRGWTLVEQGTGGDRDRANAPGPGRFSGDRGRAGTVILSSPAGRGIWEGGTERGRAAGSRGGIGWKRQQWRRGGGVVSA